MTVLPRQLGGRCKWFDCVVHYSYPTGCPKKKGPDEQSDELMRMKNKGWLLAASKDDMDKIRVGLHVLKQVEVCGACKL